MCRKETPVQIELVVHGTEIFGEYTVTREVFKAYLKDFDMAKASQVDVNEEFLDQVHELFKQVPAYQEYKQKNPNFEINKIHKLHYNNIKDRPKFIATSRSGGTLATVETIINNNNGVANALSGSKQKFTAMNMFAFVQSLTINGNKVDGQLKNLDGTLFTGLFNEIKSKSFGIKNENEFAWYLLQSTPSMTSEARKLLQDKAKGFTPNRELANEMLALVRHDEVLMSLRRLETDVNEIKKKILGSAGTKEKFERGE
jgi:hypothetical protein